MLKLCLHNLIAMGFLCYFLYYSMGVHARGFKFVRSKTAPFMTMTAKIQLQPVFRAGSVSRTFLMMTAVSKEPSRLQRNMSLSKKKEAEEYLKKNLEIKKALEENKVVPVKVYVHPLIREHLRLSGKQKRPKIFVPVGEECSISSLQCALENELKKLKKFPYRLGVRPSLEENKISIVQSEEDLEAAFRNSQTQDGPNLQLFVQPDPNFVPPPQPFYLENMPSPSDSPTLTPVSFFTFNSIEDPNEYAKELRHIWEPFQALGRVYVANEGVNAQMAVPTSVLSNFEQACKSLPELSGIFVNKDDPLTREEYYQLKPFEKLSIRVRPQVVADGGLDPLNWSDCGKGLAPLEWHEALEQNDAVLLDCRNDYETDIGRFEGSLPLNTSYFRQTWDTLQEVLKDHPKDKPVMMYCTGGIRCIKVGAYVKQTLGFQNVQRLEGGVINYAQALKGQAEEMVSKFKGKNYVFDNRLGQEITPDILSTCDQCGEPCNTHVNCAHTKCHVRFIQCPQCASRYGECCSKGCQHQHTLIQASVGSHPSPVVRPELVPLPLELQNRWLEPSPFQNARLNRMFDSVMEDYAEKYTSEEPAHLKAVREATSAAMPNAAHMVSGHLQGRLLATLTRLSGATQVLEIGTFTGYSALCFAEALPHHGHVTTVELDPIAADFAEKNFKAYLPESGAKVNLIRGRAAHVLESLAKEGLQYDLIFIDGDKKMYIDYYNQIFRSGLLSKNGIVLADNVLYKGGVLEFENQEPVFSEDKKVLRQQRIAESLHKFNKYVHEDPKTEQVILPVRDGLAVIRWKF